MTSSKQNFQNLRKVSSQIFVKTMWSKFQQNRPKTGKVRDDHRHTHTHTLIQTHRQGSFWDNIFSPEMTEYKNVPPMVLEIVPVYMNCEMMSLSLLTLNQTTDLFIYEWLLKLEERRAKKCIGFEVVRISVLDVRFI